MERHPLRLACRAGALIGIWVSGLLAVQPSNAAGALPVPAGLTFTQIWSTGPLAQDEGQPIAESSPMVADLDGEPAVVVGDRTGYLYAYHLADGSTVPGWPVSDGGVPIDSTPSVAALGTGPLDTVFVGTGNAQRPDVGGYEAYGPSGQRLWLTAVSDPTTDARPAYGVQASLTVADLQGSTDVFAGSLDQETYALDASDGSVLTGWPFFSADSVFSTAAAGDLYGTGQEELVVGGASTAGLAMGQSYSNGGHVRVLNAQGALIYDYDTNQEVDSSPAVGGFLAGGATGVVVGTGSYWPGASDTDTLKAFTTRLGLVWSDTLDGHTSSSPALADVEGDGQLDVVEGTDTGTSGSVWVLDGATGATIWHEAVAGRVIGSVVTADITGDGYQDLLVPTVHGVEVLDGRSGAEVTVLGPDLGFQSSPLVTDDPNGTVGVTIAGYDGDNEGVVQHYEILGSNGALAVGTGSWPMFHHDPALSGTSSVLPDVGNVDPTGLTAQSGNAQVPLSWAAPAGPGNPATGYNVYEGTAPGHEAGTPVNGTTPVEGTGYSVTGLNNGTKYYFEVTAINATGEGAPSNEASAVPAAPPGAPTGLSATAGDGQVSLTWAAPSSDGGSVVTGYDVYLSTTPGTEGSPVGTATTATSASVTGLTNGTTYYFEVTANNAAGQGPTSAQASASPAVPATTTTTSPTPTSTTATSTTSTSTTTTSTTTTTTSTSTTTTRSTSTTTTSTSTSSTSTSTSTPSTSTSATTTPPSAPGPPPPSSPPLATPAAMAPGAVTGLSATAGDGQVSLSWAAPAPNGGSAVTGYNVYLSTTPGTEGSPVGSATTATSATVSGLTNGTTYYFEVTAISAAGQGPASAQAAAYPTVPPPLARTLRPPPVPSAPPGYRVASSDGDVLALGKLAPYSTPRPGSPVVGVASLPDGDGYWLVLKDGAVLSAGSATFYGSMAGKDLGSAFVGMAATPDGHGYWLVTSQGGVFGFGDAHVYGSLGTTHLKRPIVGMATTADGRGYWMVAADGGVFSFGDAPFFGSLGGNRTVVGIAI